MITVVAFSHQHAQKSRASRCTISPDSETRQPCSAQLHRDSGGVTNAFAAASKTPVLGRRRHGQGRGPWAAPCPPSRDIAGGLAPTAASRRRAGHDPRAPRRQGAETAGQEGAVIWGAAHWCYLCKMSHSN